MQTAFVWSEHLREIAWAALASLVPMFEGRYAIAIMVGMGMPLVFSYLLAFICSSVPMPFILWLYLPVVHWIQRLPYAWLGWLKKFCSWLDARAHSKASKMNTVGYLGLFLFVAIPLPGTGVWTGSLIAAVFGLNRWKSALAILLGNAVACALMAFFGLGIKAMV